jgi:threonine dehydratase
MSLPIAYSDIEAAAVRLRNTARHTPVLTAAAADALSGAQVLFKCENLQRTGSFKFRGAYNALAQFTPEQRRRGVIAFSSGNHAQAIALAARLLGMPAAIAMPSDAPRAKIDATRDHGAEVIEYDRYTEDRDAIGARIAAERGMTLVPPFNHPHVMAGQGTAAKELLEEVGPLDVLVAPLGGGGLLSGCAVAAARLAPGCRVIGIEPAAGNDIQQSLQRGEIVKIPVPQTIADGAQTQCAGPLTFAVINALVAAVATVSDEALLRTVRFFAAQMKLVVEPTGCLAAAAALERALPIDLHGKRVGVIVSGGNVDLGRYAEWVGAAV